MTDLQGLYGFLSRTYAVCTVSTCQLFHGCRRLACAAVQSCLFKKIPLFVIVYLSSQAYSPPYKAMEPNRRIRPRNEQAQGQQGGSSSTTRKTGMETSVSAATAAVSSSSSSSVNKNLLQPTKTLSEDDDTMDAELVLLSAVVGMGDKEAQYLYEKCGDSVTSYQRLYRFLLDKKVQSTSSEQQRDELTHMDTKPTAPGAAATAWTVDQLLPHEKHNLALLQFLLSSSSNSQPTVFPPTTTETQVPNVDLNQILQQFQNTNSDSSTSTTQNTSSSNPTITTQEQQQDNKNTYLCEPSLKRLQSLIAGYNLGLLTLCQGNDPKTATTLLASYFFSLEQGIQESSVEEEEDDEDEKQEQVTLDQATRNVLCQISFALLDGIMACMTGCASHVRKQQEYFKISSSSSSSSSQGHVFINTVELIQRVLNWLESYIQSMALTEMRLSAGNLEDGVSHAASSSIYSYTQDSSSELKFRLMCYKSRLWFILGSTLTTTKGDLNLGLGGGGIMNRYSDFDEVTRAARKELKNAMEIFHHKLESEGKANATTVSGGDVDLVLENSTAKMSTLALSYSSVRPSHMSSVKSSEPTALSDVDLVQNQLELLSKYRMKKLQSQHQNALYLKAYLEFLKNNMKKSLKLCSEALNGNDREGVDSTWMESELSTLNGIPKEQDANNNTLLFLNPRREATPDMAQRVTNYEAAVFNNNLGLIHQSSGKLHLALHYYARALSELERMEQLQTTMNGVIMGFEPNVGIAHSLHLTTSQVLINTAICAQQARNFVTGYECMARCVMACQALFYDRPWFWLNMAESCIGIHAELSRTGKSVESQLTDEMQSLIDKASSMPLNEDGSIVLLGSEHDVSFVKRYPLTRALFCLNTCIWLTNVSSAGGHSGNEEDENCVESARLILAYVWLELNNPALALKEADAVIHAPDNMHFKYDRERRLAIAHVYANEAAATLR